MGHKAGTTGGAQGRDDGWGTRPGRRIWGIGTGRFIWGQVWHDVLFECTNNTTVIPESAKRATVIPEDAQHLSGT